MAPTRIDAHACVPPCVKKTRSPPRRPELPSRTYQLPSVVLSRPSLCVYVCAAHPGQGRGRPHARRAVHRDDQRLLNIGRLHRLPQGAWHAAVDCALSHMCPCGPVRLVALASSPPTGGPCLQPTREYLPMFVCAAVANVDRSQIWDSSSGQCTQTLQTAHKSIISSILQYGVRTGARGLRVAGLTGSGAAHGRPCWIHGSPEALSTGHACP